MRLGLAHEVIILVKQQHLLRIAYSCISCHLRWAIICYVVDQYPHYWIDKASVWTIVNTMREATRHTPTNICRLELEKIDQQESTTTRSNCMHIVATEVLPTVIDASVSFMKSSRARQYSLRWSQLLQKNMWLSPLGSRE